jgi:hypothetical protein
MGSVRGLITLKQLFGRFWQGHWRWNATWYEFVGAALWRSAITTQCAMLVCVESYELCAAVSSFVRAGRRSGYFSECNQGGTPKNFLIFIFSSPSPSPFVYPWHKQFVIHSLPLVRKTHQHGFIQHSFLWSVVEPYARYGAYWYHSKRSIIFHRSSKH